MATQLKDPWARNEAWRHAHGASKNMRQMFPGFGIALSAFMLYVAVDTVNEKKRQRAAAKHGHGHGDHHGHDSKPHHDAPAAVAPAPSGHH